MTKVKRIILVVFVLIFAFAISGCNSKTVAVVNGEKISKTKLDKLVNKKKVALEQQGVSFTSEQGKAMLTALEQQTVQQLISEALILQQAKKEGTIASAEETKKQIEDLKARFGGSEKFEEALKQYAYTAKELEEKVKFDLSYSKLYEKITAGIKVDETEAQKYYDKNKDQYKEPVQIEARAILIKFDNPNNPATEQKTEKVGRTEEQALKIAEGVITKLQNGESFKKLVDESSEDAKSKADGGLIKDPSGKSPYAKGTVMPAEFDQAALALKDGKYTKTPVKTAEGFYIIQLESTVPEKQLTFDEAKDRIMQELPAQRKQEKFNEYFSQVEKNSKIEDKTASAETADQKSGQPSTQP